uniref:Sulfotransferase 6B1 (inferred by orthology to a human protein) n=1 Tax=Strongyloides venezuelensis TaxID=75913 RepID=A0A0K0F407_STRVS
MVEIDNNIYVEAAINRIKKSIYCEDDKRFIIEEEGKPVFREVDVKLFFASRILNSIRSAMKMQHRDDDTTVTSWPKSGSIWLRHIVLQLVYEDYFKHQYLKPPMIEFIGSNIVDSQSSSRSLKTHFSLSYFPMTKNDKYNIIVRNAKDVLASFYHHMKLIPACKFEDCNFNVFFYIFVSGKKEFGSYFNYLIE